MESKATAKQIMFERRVEKKNNGKEKRKKRGGGYKREGGRIKNNLRLVIPRKVGIIGQMFEMECPISSPFIESPKPIYHFEAYRLLCAQKAIILSYKKAY